MRVQWSVAGILPLVLGALCAPAQPQLPAAQLVREVVYNELHDHQSHGYWRYWVEQHTAKETWREEQVETADGLLKRLVLENGRALDTASLQNEQARLDHLLNSPQEQTQRHQEYIDDEKRIGRILALLPNAFIYEDAGQENGCYHLRYRPNPAYPPHSIEARIFHAMSGEVWIDASFKHVVRLEGRLQENVDFGFGILGRLYKGGWFRLERIRVSATDWKTEKLEVHIGGRAMLFKSIARETSEVRGGFAPVPTRLSLAQGVSLLLQPQSPVTTAEIKSAAFVPLR
jgi:hypothetical protein